MTDASEIEPDRTGVGPNWPRRFVGLIGVLACSLSVMLSVWGDLDSAVRFGAVGTCMLITCGAMVTWYFGPSLDPHVRESRERVLDAERDLEVALRGPLNEGVDTLAIWTVTADDEAGRERVYSHGLALSELWAVTHRRLDLYHSIATTQASRSFRNAQIAMVLGFVLLVVFVIVALRASTTAGAVVVGGLGAVAAALAGYVSRTFVRSQEAAAGHLRAYFDQPLEFSRYLAAERLVADSSLSGEQRAEVVAELAKAMIAGPPAPNADATNASNGDAGSARA